MFYWTEAELNVVRRVIDGKIDLDCACATLTERTRESVRRMALKMKSGLVESRSGRHLAEDDDGFEDGEWIARRVSAREASEMLLAAIARWHPERVIA